MRVLILAPMKFALSVVDHLSMIRLCNDCSV